MSILTPTETREDIDVPVSGDAASAGTFTQRVTQRLLNRIYMVERILDGLYTRAVFIKGFFQALGNIDLGSELPTPSTITMRGNTTVKSFFRTEGRVGDSTLIIRDQDASSTLKRNFIYKTQTTNRTLTIDMEGAPPVLGDTFTVWARIASWGVYVNTVNGYVSPTWFVPGGTHTTFIANDVGQFEELT